MLVLPAEWAAFLAIWGGFWGFGADEGGQTDWTDKTDIPLMGGAEVLGYAS